MAKRPSIKSPCVADHYHAPGERIAEISGAGGVCLLSVREYTRGDGRPGLRVEVYAADETVMVRPAKYAQPKGEEA